MVQLRSLVIALLAAGAAGSAGSTSVSGTPSAYGDIAHERCSATRLRTANDDPESR